MNFRNFKEIDFKQIRPGVFAKVITGEKMQLCYIRLEPGQVTNHNHPEEQMGYILSGEVELTIGDEKKICTNGHAYYIPSNVQHGFKVLSKMPLEYIEMFSPPKKS